MGKSDREVRIKEIKWLPMRPFDKPPTRRQRLNWLLWFGQLSEEEYGEFIRGTFDKGFEGHLGFFQTLVGNIFGYLPRWVWTENGETKFSDWPPLEKPGITEKVIKLFLETVPRTRIVIRSLVEDVLRPIKKGTLVKKRINCSAEFYIGMSLFEGTQKSKKGRTLRKTQLLDFKGLSMDMMMSIIEWNLTDLLDGFPLDDIKVCKECGRLYVPLKKPKGSKYCSKKCQNRATWVRHKIKQATEEGGE